MTPRPYIVNVFAGRPYIGNPLGVVLGADELTDEAMQRIATEPDYSETAFVMSAQASDGGWRVRLFTPAREIAFAGHPILGTAWVIRRCVAWESDILFLQLRVGIVPVAFESDEDQGEVVWFAAPPIRLGKICPVELIAAAFGLSPQDIETDPPVRDIGADTSALIVPVRSLEALRRAKPDMAAFELLAREGFAPRFYLFSRETHDPGNDLCARFFFEANGVREDPASGNAAAFLGAYLLEHRVLFTQRELSLRIEQGHAVGRPSLVLLQARQSRHREIRVGGHVEWYRINQ
jgi:trans-2,3-dihydro-3-hydroxyanthranilate isomerase